jgi:single-stranded-DNA-specific exonuclease
MTYIPDRCEDGYGLSEQVIDKLRQQNIDFIITVDCGISCFDAVEFANNSGVDIVITDHHIGPKALPNARAVVNPNRIDDNSDYKYLAGVGVAFLVCIAMNTYLRKVNYYQEKNLKEQNLLHLLDLVALGTVCDVMPLIGLNRAFVKQGMKVINMRTNLGLAVLSDMIGLRDISDTYHLGYIIGPRINASGRVGNANIGNQLLSCEDKVEAKYLVEQLNSFNLERRSIEKDILLEAIGQIETRELSKNPVIFVEGSDWHDGVIGIIASRIKDKYNRPVFVISRDGEFGKASCRSVDKSVDIGSVIIRAKEQKLIITGGGHAVAGGFTFEINRLFEIKSFVEDNIRAKLNHYLDQNEKYADLVLTVDTVNEQLVKEIGKIGPFGSDNPRPTIILRDVSILSVRKFKKNGEHIQCIVGGNSMIGSRNRVVANIFRASGDEIERVLMGEHKHSYDLIGNISLNRWKSSNNLQFTVDDIIVNPLGKI